MQFDEIVTESLNLIKIFKKVETREWTAEVMAVELMSEVGTLADSMMMMEKFRPMRKGTFVDLNDDLADVLFIIIRIANHYGVNLEQAYIRMIDMTRNKLIMEIGSNTLEVE